MAAHEGAAVVSRAGRAGWGLAGRPRRLRARARPGGAKTCARGEHRRLAPRTSWRAANGV